MYKAHTNEQLAYLHNAIGGAGGEESNVCFQGEMFLRIF